MKKYFILFGLLISGISNADTWSPSGGSLVATVNPGGNGGAGTVVALEGVVFAGCAKNEIAFLQSSNEDYKEIFSTILAAKMSKYPIRIYYGNDGGADCAGNYPIIKQVAIN